MTDMLREMLRVPTVSTDEGRMREYIALQIGEYFPEKSVDSYGNLILRRPGGGKRILICAPMDDFGVIATRAEKDSVNISGLGKFDFYSASYSTVTFSNGTRAVLIPPKSIDENTKLSDFTAFTGEIAEDSKRVMPGDKGYFESNAFSLTDGLLCGQGLSSRVGAAVVMAAVKEKIIPCAECDCDVTLLFYAASKLDCRGLYIGASGQVEKVGKSFDFAAVVTAHDEVNGACEVGKGLALRLVSRRFVCPETVVEKVKSYFVNRSLPLQLFSDNTSDSPAAELAQVYTGIPVCELCVPVRNYATSAEITYFSVEK